MRSIAEQVAREFREAARYRGLPTPEGVPPIDLTQDVLGLFRAATRRAAGVRIVSVP